MGSRSRVGGYWGGGGGGGGPGDAGQKLRGAVGWGERETPWLWGREKKRDTERETDRQASGLREVKCVCVCVCGGGGLKANTQAATRDGWERRD